MDNLEFPVGFTCMFLDYRASQRSHTIMGRTCKLNNHKWLKDFDLVAIVWI